ncbi:MAG: heparinase II/III family protein [Bacteroidales bacterium]|nr:heparinase II/III family protein [Bacteroidales bacterium]MCL2133014.1 heparinase II/III family protein [Bacteroidales bacterium]
MKRFITAILLIFGLFTCYAQKHPNLVFTQEGAAQIKNNLGKYPLLDLSIAEAKAKVAANIAQGIEVPVPKDPGGGYTHEKHKLNYDVMLNAAMLWQITGEKFYAEFVREMLLAYAKLYPTLGIHPEGVNSGVPGKLFWQSLNDAVWLVHAAQAYDCVYDYLNSDERKNIENNLLRLSVKFSMEDRAETFNRIHNHGLWAICGVAMTGYVLNDKDMVEKAIYGSNKDKKTGFLSNIDALFSPDGYYCEGSYYLRYAIMPTILLAKTIQNNQPDLHIYAYKDSTLAKSIPALLQQTDPIGQFLPFNDALKDKAWTSGEIVYAVNIAYNDIAADPLLLYAAQQQGRVMLSADGVVVAKAIGEGKAPANFKWKSMELRDGSKGDQGGVAMLRYGQTPDAMAATMKYGTFGMEHGHLDKLTIGFYDQGREILSDYGSARFINIEQKRGGRYLPENKTFVNQTIAHNTVTVDQKSNYGGNTKKADECNAVRYYFNASDERLQIVSAKDTTAYPGVKMQRTIALLQPDDSYFTRPFLLDLFNLQSEKPHQYDLAYYYQGDFIHTGIKYDYEREMQAAGGSQGYQHLWLRAQGTAANDNESFTWINAARFYTITTICKPEKTQLLMVQSGANDPEFNLRNENGIIFREQNSNSRLFASVIEPHGSFSPITEASLGSYANIVRLKEVVNNAAVTAVTIEARNGKRWLFAISNNNTDPNANHSIELNGKTVSWAGTHVFIMIND